MLEEIMCQNDIVNEKRGKEISRLRKTSTK